VRHMGTRALLEDEQKPQIINSTNVRVHAYLDDEDALNTLAKSIATASTVHGFRRFSCTTNLVKAMQDRKRVFVYITCVSDSQPPASTGVVFTAMPPGANPSGEHLAKFIASVHDRLRRGDVVDMRCRGAHAVAHSMRALCQFQVHVAQFEVEYVQESASSVKTAEGTVVHSNSDVSSLRVRACRGMTWKDFNDTDFAVNELLFATATSPVKGLCSAVASAVQKQGAVTIQAYSDNKLAMHVAVRALAIITQVWKDARISVVPSFGRTKAQKSPVIRFYVKQQNV